MGQTFRVSENAHVEIRDCETRVSVVGWGGAHTAATRTAARW
jgi:hypothetical protein